MSAIVGAMIPPVSAAPINRGRAVVRYARDQLVVSGGAPATCQPLSHRQYLTAEEWEALVASGQATALGPLCVPAGAAVGGAVGVWVFRPHMRRRAESLAALEEAGACLGSVGADDGTRWCVVDEGRGARLRERWCEDALAEAVRLGDAGQCEAALAEAEQAQALASGLDGRVLAVLAEALRRVGRLERAAGVARLAERFGRP